VRPASIGEPELERLWLDGDPAALAEAHRRYRGRLEAVAFRIVHDRADAEDVVQRIFLALPRAAYRGSASLWSYLYRAALNGSVNVLRARRRRESMGARIAEHGALRDPVPDAAPDARVLEGEILAAVAKGLLHVRPQHRRVLVLRVVHGLTNTEIAEREGLPLATVGTWLRRGREELRRALGPVLRDLGRHPR
jgi:RNA polymerase sigma-70 factor (ECF subfamily)